MEPDSLDLDGKATVRGFVFYRGTFSGKDKQKMVQVEYQNRKFTLPNGPCIFILDSQGVLHNFNYYDIRYVESTQSLLMDPMEIEALRGCRLKPSVKANKSMMGMTDSFLSKKPKIKSRQSEMKDNHFWKMKPIISEGFEQNRANHYLTGSPFMKHSIQKNRFFEYQGCSKSMANWGDENGDSPYLLGIFESLL